MNRTPQVTGSIAAVGLMALGHHIAEHHLPSVTTIDVETHGRVVAIKAWLATYDAEQWLATVTRHSTDVRESAVPGHQLLVEDVTLPDTGTRLHLWHVQQAPVEVPDNAAGLYAVPAMRKPVER